MQIIMSGLIMGCIYGLAALGLVLIYKTTMVVNFAQGEMAMLTTFISFGLLTKYNFSYFTSFIGALIISLLLGAVIYAVFMNRVQSADHLNQIVITLGLFLIINGVAGLLWGHQPESFPTPFSDEVISLGSVLITRNDIFIIVSTLLLMGVLYVLFNFTKIGLAMRASAQDLTASRLMGIKVPLVFMSTWAIGTVLGGVAGMMTAPLTFLSPTMMFEILIMAFASAVLGGFIFMPGVIIGGLIVGVFGNVVSYYYSPEMKIVYTFLLIIIILYIRPQGIFGGKQTVKKV
ncbi:branched-chain amino acid ABC transporter permease [Bacillus sp. EB106-08-02-XG196]|uniref:branched-chain amino acid ABC transporter permease n=1 Tax=Bacillus sp. EB106-08-02-XG196 TaxID=2737049 RepID=UPI0015C4C10E|nr:branched-chain amino acid ABC transporter permease [Bacillus sp. EB106-08-02-XG196]NWQ43743.1 branched-chain amino acid ABC transporter permease [Bacillus sp. EB106-08-02-XG196]